MNQLKLFSSLLVLIFILSSCSLEKKIYSSGYHVEWNGNSCNSKTEIKKEKLVSITKNQIRENKVGNKKVSPIAKLLRKNYPIDFQKAKTVWRKKISNASCENKRDTVPSKSAKLQPQKNKVPSSDKKTNECALLSFVFAMLAILGFLLSAYTIIFSALLIAFLFAVAAFIVGIVSIAQFKKIPDAYNNKWLLWFGFTLSLFELIILGFFTYDLFSLRY